MNSELQAQSDVLVKAIANLETTLHQDIIFATAAICVLLVVLIIVAMVHK
jgi:hypothetical protein